MTSNPSISGIITSRRTRSGRCSIAHWMPAGPDSASSKSYVARSRLWVTIRRIKGSSSTTNTLGLVWGADVWGGLGAGTIVRLFYNEFGEYQNEFCLNLNSQTEFVPPSIESEYTL